MTSTSPNVLIAEPDPAVQKTLADCVAALGAEPVLAPDGGTALRIAQSRRLHAGVIDVALPDLPGLRLFQMIRTHGEVPVLFVGRTESKEIRLQIADAGAWSFLPIPLDQAVVEMTFRLFVGLFFRGETRGF